MPPEHIAAGGTDDLVEHTGVVAVLPGLEFELPRAGGDQRRQIADPRHSLVLAGANGTPQRIGLEVFVIGNADTNRHTTALVDLW